MKLELTYSEGKIIRLKQYSLDAGNLEFEGEYINRILKKGKEYKNNELVFFLEIKLENKEQFISGNYLSYYYGKKRWIGKGKERRFPEYLIKAFDEITFEDYDYLVYEGDYLEGKKTGFGKIYNEKTGILFYEGELLNCEKHGKGKLNDKEGNLKIEGDFIKDKINYKNGFIKEYEDGKLSTETEYLDEIPLRAKHYNKEGIAILEYQDSKCKDYYDNGKLKQEGDYYYGYNGIMKKYYENGKLLFEGEVKNNKRRNGKEYDENGEIIDEIKNGESLKYKNKVIEEEKEE